MADWFERKTSRKGKMLLQEEGRGKFSSPHSIKLLGETNPP
jgi:hypothetical protein